jgi:preprotein translocase subunit SecF
MFNINRFRRRSGAIRHKVRSRYRHPRSIRVIGNSSTPCICRYTATHNMLLSALIIMIVGGGECLTNIHETACFDCNV